MADSIVSVAVSEPVSQIVRAAADIAVAGFNYAAVVRQTADQAGRDAADRISYQAYWDFRNALKWARIVGEPESWPPAPAK